ncbi:ANR family transcriptional regulator [Vibrio harveyi]|uniref:ANR family transcriptional regulator n=1 Tax=Vibrio harveyi TaxID=669 RepID=UPI000680AA3B|nr:ANR family transcriptional regulator [Vibrio harveyi]
MFINMKFEIVAEKAREAEQRRDWIKAMELWQLASPLAKKDANHDWAKIRTAFCEVRYRRDILDTKGELQNTYSVNFL